MSALEPAPSLPAFDSIFQAPTLVRRNRDTARQIVGYLREGRYCALLGPRFSGKTQVLQHVEAEVRQVLGSYLAHVDLYDLRATTQVGFFSALAGLTMTRIQDLAHRTLPSPEPTGMSSAAFRGFLTDLVSQLGQDLVLIVDHLEAVPSDLIQALMTSLRAAYMEQQTYDYRLTVVISGALSLAELTVGESSPFRGIAQTLFVGDLSDDESEALIAEHVAAQPLSLTPRARRRLLDASRGDPNLIWRLYRDCVRTAREMTTDLLNTEMVDRTVARFLDKEVNNYAPLQEAVRAIEDDPDLLRCVLLLLERHVVPKSELPLPLSPDLDPLRLTGVVQKVPEQRYRLRNDIYRLFLARHFHPGRVGHLLTTAGHWDHAIDYLEASIRQGNGMAVSDLLPAAVQSMFASDDISRAAHFLLRGLSAGFGIDEAQVWYAPPGEGYLQRIGHMGSATKGDPWERQVLPIGEDCLTTRAFRDASSLRGSESDQSVQRALPLLIPGRRAIGVVALNEPVSSDGFGEQRERELHLVGYLNQAARALQQVARRTQEIALAGRMQASLLPQAAPRPAGWHLAASLQPARETSGDFYDFIPLSRQRWGIVIADVTDKGLAAALYMALSRTLIRTYADDYPDRPDLVLSAASRRMLTDTRAGFFVTVFYGILDPAINRLTYCNAGHHPPYLLGQGGSPPRSLERTGMALGAVEDAIWTYATVDFQPGDVLALYTDGVVDAQNPDLEPFGRERMIEVMQQRIEAPEVGEVSADDLLDALIAAVRGFAGAASQFDDIAVVVVQREAKPAPAELPPAVQPEPVRPVFDSWRMGPPYRV